MKNSTERFYVITGGPGVGKTTLIEGLRDLGFNTIDEDARKIIKNQVEIQGQGLPWKNKELYAQLMLEESMKSYDTVRLDSTPQITFFDRGVLDALCYIKMEEIAVPEQWRERTASYRYNNSVFILPPWREIYTQDTERKQSWEEAVSTFQKMKQIYLDFGYTVVEVPKVTIEERIQFIVNKIFNTLIMEQENN